jgi:hypothetical protein
MDLKEATEKEIKGELHRREVEGKRQHIIDAVNQIRSAFTAGVIESVKWGQFDGNRSSETKWITVFFK